MIYHELLKNLVVFFPPNEPQKLPSLDVPKPVGMPIAPLHRVACTDPKACHRQQTPPEFAWQGVPGHRVMFDLLRLTEILVFLFTQN